MIKFFKDEMSKFLKNVYGKKRKPLEVSKNKSIPESSKRIS